MRLQVHKRSERKTTDAIEIKQIYLFIIIRKEEESKQGLSTEEKINKKKYKVFSRWHLNYNN